MKTILGNIIFTLIAVLVPGRLATAQDQSAFKLPKYEKFVLGNGLTVYLMEQHEIPVIGLTAIIPAGAIYDGEKYGEASITATCLQYGTKNFSRDQIQEQLDFAGATLNTNASKEFAILSAKFASKDQDKILTIIKEVLVEPVFSAAEFDKEQKLELVNLQQDKESPGTVIRSYWDAFFYGDHVYGNPISGSISTLSKLTTEDVKTFYQANYIPNGSAIAVVGDFKTRDMKAAITNLFNGWKKNNKTQSNTAAKTISAHSSARVLLINKDDATETTLIIGGPGVKRNNPDDVAIQVVNTVFGGRFTSWLNNELRVNSGLTYGAGSYFSSLKNGGTFIISTHTATETTAPTIDKTLEVINRLHSRGIDEETLTSAKNLLKGQFPPRYETSSQLSNLLTQMFWYGLNDSYINNFESNVDAVDISKARDIIAKYFPENNLQFVLIGKSSEIEKIAAKYGTVTEVEIKKDGFNAAAR